MVALCINISQKLWIVKTAGEEGTAAAAARIGRIHGHLPLERLRDPVPGIAVVAGGMEMSMSSVSLCIGHVWRPIRQLAVFVAALSFFPPPPFSLSSAGLVLYLQVCSWLLLLVLTEI